MSQPSVYEAHAVNLLRLLRDAILEYRAELEREARHKHYQETTNGHWALGRAVRWLDERLAPLRERIEAAVGHTPAAPEQPATQPAAMARTVALTGDIVPGPFARAVLGRHPTPAEERSVKEVEVALYAEQHASRPSTPMLGCDLSAQEAQDIEEQADALYASRDAAPGTAEHSSNFFVEPIVPIGETSSPEATDEGGSLSEIERLTAAVKDARAENEGAARSATQGRGRTRPARKAHRPHPRKAK